MLDYASEAGMSGAKLASNAAARPLERISLAADRIDHVARRLDRFVDRYHGNPSPISTATEPAPPSSYAANIERLFGAIERAEKLAEAINEIG